MAQAEDNTQMEMELMLKEQVDPVSGNTAPLGSTPEEVRDDVPINASAGEFMINAQTVNYFGEEFFTNLQDTAAEGWQRIKEGKESFFRDDELEVAEVDDVPTDEVQSMAYGGTVRGYAEGDEITDEIANKEVPKPVGGGYGGYGGTGSTFTGFEMRRVKDPVTGRTKKVAFFNGRPLTALKSYVDVSSEGETEEAAPAAATQRRDDDRPDVDLGDYGGSFRDKNLNDWTNQDFRSYKNSMTEGKEGTLSGMETGVLQTVGNLIIPGGGFALTKLANMSNAKQAEKVFKRTSELITAGKGTAEILAANKASYNTGKNLEGQTFFDSVGLGFLDGDKPPEWDADSLFKGAYKPPSIPSGAKADALSQSISPVPPTLERTKFDTISSAKGFLGGSEKDAFDNAIRTGDQAMIRHFEGIDRLRNRQNEFIKLPKEEQNRRIAEGRKGEGLSVYDMQQAQKFGGSAQKAIDSGSAEKVEGSGLFGTNFLASYKPKEEDADNSTAK